MAFRTNSGPLLPKSVFVFTEPKGFFGRQNIFRQKIGTHSLHDTCSDNNLKIIHFSTNNTPYTTKPYNTWVSPVDLTKSQINHVLIDKRKHTSIKNVRSCRGADCYFDYYLVVAIFLKNCLDWMITMNDSKSKSCKIKYKIDNLTDLSLDRGGCGV